MAIFDVLTNLGFSVATLLLEEYGKPKGLNKDVDENSISLRFPKLDYQVDLFGKYDLEEQDGVVERIKISSIGNKGIEDETLVEISDIKESVGSLDFLILLTAPEVVILRVLDQKFTVNGGRGDDYLVAGDGKYFGGFGDDTLASFGNAAFDGGPGKFDVVNYLGKTSEDELGVTASLSNSSINQGAAKGDAYVSIECLTGTQYDDLLIGDGKRNILDGAKGDDTLEGGKAKDDLIGGKDTDYASYQNALSLKDDFVTGVEASLTEGRGFVGEAKGDAYDGIEGLIGSFFNDTLTGSTGVDTIFGGNGNDTIQGGGREDTLWGDLETFESSGSDTFVMNLRTAGAVKIMDYDASDTVAISRNGFGLGEDFDFEDGVNFISADDPAAETAGPTFLFDRGAQGGDFRFTGQLFFDADGTGSGAAELIATIRFDSQEFLDINDVTLI